ncbi:uncharacterized protein LOC107196798 isoform X2 [Astyanax mexicanus]|uniref:uncharacterized protein LOC107196798 isoform X2 n=1 Tax=Astyanax mexicanus TaxID=7994 RepID=UPI0020CB1E97|nr:uncharacterized protein LOC107196798 isoform X2 [Astyanax mexicanus]
MEGAGLQSSPSDKTVKDSCKYLTVCLGQTLACHTDIQNYLCERRPELEEAINDKDCDVFLAFCHIDPQLKESIETFLGNLPGSKPVALVVLHQTAENIASDFSVDLSRRNMVKVVYLLQENEELQQYSHNKTSLNEVADWLISEVRREKSRKHPDPCTTVKLFKQPLQKYLIIRPGKTLRCYESIMESLQKQRPELQEVFTAEECDVILVFCRIDTQGGSDIHKTMNLLARLPDSKPVALVVLHQTSDPEHVVPDRSGLFTREVMLEVDFLFHENEELLPCTKNESSMNKVEHWLISGMKKKKPAIKNADPCTTVKMVKQPLHKYLIIRPGKTLKCHENIMQSLQKQRPELQEVLIAEECDVILAFCHIIPQGGNDIEITMNLLASLPDSKPVVLVVLHQTYDPAHITDISGTVTRGNMVKVHFLFHENEELLQCPQNESSLRKIAQQLIPKGSMTPDNTAVSKEISTQYRPQMKNISVKMKVFCRVTGNTLGSHKQFVGTLCSRRAGIQEVSTVEECNIILCFCPVVSQAGTDIEAALQKLDDIPVTKDVVLVVLHHTFDPEFTVPDSSRSVSRENTLTVDCLFYEDRGILHCRQNEEAFRTVFKLMDTKASTKTSEESFTKTLPNKCAEVFKEIKEKWNEVTFARPNFFTSSEAVKLPSLLQIKNKIKVFSFVTGKTLDSHKEFVKTLCNRRAGLREVFTVEECDVILCFCPVVSRAGTDIEAALQKLNNVTQGSHPVVLVVLHHMFDAESIVPDSSKSVARTSTLAVDCLFFEDRGILSCSKNEEAYRRVLAWIESQDDTQLKRFKNDSYREEGGACGQM